MAKIALKDHPKFKLVKKDLSINNVQLIGHLELLWQTSYQLVSEKIPKFTKEEIEIAAEWDGEYGLFCEILFKRGFIDLVDDEHYEIHDLNQHAPDWIKKRLKRIQDNGCVDFVQKDLSDNGGQRRTTADNGGQNLPLLDKNRLEKKRKEKKRKEIKPLNPFSLSDEILSEPTNLVFDVREKMKEILGEKILLPFGQRDSRFKITSKNINSQEFTLDEWIDIFNKYKTAEDIKGKLLAEQQYVDECWITKPDNISKLFAGHYTPKGKKQSLADQWEQKYGGSNEATE